MTFKSKRDFWLGLLIWVPMLIALVPVFISDLLIIQVLMLVAILFVGWIWFGTFYTVHEDVVVVRCGPFRERIKISEIKSISPAKTVLASSALSMDRLELKHGKWGVTIISPENKEGLIQALLEKNPNIVVS